MTTDKAYGEEDLTVLDRAGVWLSARAVRRHVDLRGKRIADLGCGYAAMMVRPLLDEVQRAVLVDVALSRALKDHHKVHAIEGLLPDVLQTLETCSLDVVLALAVLEHLVEPQRMLDEVFRILAPGGVAIVNVPSWRGKPVLEFVAFRMGISSASMDDHKTYYDPRDLWPMLVKAGFRPSTIRCRRHKLSFATLGVARKTAAPGETPPRASTGPAVESASGLKRSHRS
jgi:SAM-dependent methyltransferase